MLLTHRQLMVCKAASTEPDRPQLNGVHIAPDGSTTATDGHILVHVGPCALDSAADYPRPFEGWEAPAVPKDGFILPSADALAAAKNAKACSTKGTRSLPVLNGTVLLEALNGRVVLSSTDLDARRVTEARPLEGQYPNWPQVVPALKPEGEGVYVVGINLPVLKKLLTALDAVGLAEHQAMRLQFGGPLSAIRIDATTGEGEPVLAVLMPARLDSRLIHAAPPFPISPPAAGGQPRRIP